MHASLFVVVLSVGAPAIKDAPKKDDIAGVWVIESSVSSGRPRKTPPGGQTRYEFLPDGTWNLYRGDRKMEGNRAYRVDRNTNPPSITLKYDAAEQDGREALGIYKVEGDHLTLCYCRPDADKRPTDFESPAGSGFTLVVLKRVKSKD